MSVVYGKGINDMPRGWTSEDEWNRMVERAMRKDYSWQTSARKYQEMYDWLIGY